MYSLRSRPSVRCNATTRKEKHSNMRKTYFEKRRVQDKNVRATFGNLAKDERERLSSIWDAHKEFFAKESKDIENDSVVEPIVVDNEDLESANGFFEEN